MSVIDFTFFFFNDTATTEIYTLSLHDALPICQQREHLALAQQLRRHQGQQLAAKALQARCAVIEQREDRKSTRLNSSHPSISYAVFCLKKKTYIYKVRIQ